jgi:hypothetical protein
MTPTNTLPTPTINPSLLVKFALAGGAIGLIFISLFVFGVKNPNPAWGQLWRIKPLIMAPLGGAAGGAFFCLINNLKLQGFKKALAITVSIIGFLIALWMGVVLGLNGTMWD